MDKIGVKVVNISGLDLPEYKTEGSAGMDLRSAVDTTLNPGCRILVPTLIQIALPKGYEAQVRPRSGLALKYGVTVLNSPGTIDSDYRGEIGVILINQGDKPFEIKKGDRIAQLVISRYEQIDWDPVDSLDETERGAGGFGHSGVK